MSEVPKVPFTGTAAAQVRNTQEVVIGSSGGCRNTPAIGMGTAADQRYYDSSAFKPAILEAIKHRYRHFDTAAAYNSEPYLGEAIAEALQLGLIASRDELFITSKLWCKGCSSRSCHPCSQ